MVANSSDGSDCEIVQSVQNSDFTFDPLTPNVRKAICDCLSMPFHKADQKHVKYRGEAVQSKS